MIAPVSVCDLPAVSGAVIPADAATAEGVECLRQHYLLAAPMEPEELEAHRRTWVQAWATPDKNDRLRNARAEMALADAFFGRCAAIRQAARECMAADPEHGRELCEQAQECYDRADAIYARMEREYGEEQE